MTQETGTAVLVAPAGTDPDWREKISRATEARRAAQEIRKDKPIQLPSSWSLQLRSQ